MIRKLALLITLLIPVAAGAQVTLDEVKSGTLLLKTAQPGVFIAAPTVDTDVDLRVRGLILRGEVTQRFLNPESTCVEAVYAFPLPEDSAVDTLRMKVGNRVIEGEIKEKEDAKKTYETAKRQGKKASLLTQERPNLFTVSIANIGPGENVTIAIAYQQNVDYKDGAFRLRFPMTVGPRYMPRNTPMMSAAVPTDTVGTISGSQKSHIHLSVDLDSGFSLRQVLSTYHKIDSTVISGSRYKITLNGDVAADHDFELVWQPDLGSQPRSALFTENDYALLMVVPPAVGRGARLPKETIFIIDTSGSMGGPSIDEAKSALLMAIDRLDLTDTFNIIEFNSDTHVLWTDARPATAGNVVDAKRWVGALHADGGTEMLPALEAAFRDPSPNENVVRQVIFMTDGQVGNESQLFSFIRSHLGRSRLFTVGIGSAPNSHFMRDAARFGRGTFTYIGDANEMQEKMSVLFEKLESPVLTNVELRFDDPAVEMWPQRIPDLYAGEPVVVAVKFSKPVGRVIASAKRGSEEWNDVHNMQITSEESGIGRLWARRKIEALTDGEGDVKQQVVDLALAHHLVSQYTSLVAVDHTPSSVPLQNCDTRAVPVNLPQGWGGVDGSLPGTATPAQMYMLIGIVLLAIAAAIAVRS
ncbi:MAG TPA: marine proteobacterial sortase target protein [Thermoanaerobaculia bacterium]